MKLTKTTIVILLVLLVAAIFFFKPYLLGKGETTPLAILPPDDKMSIPTDVACASVQDCMNYAKTLDPNTEGLEATCAGTCTFIMPKVPVASEVPK